ncbi:MAG: phage tail length tape measure family protein [Hyphomicrobiales bacterium]|nr:phage tail length tape measure family protein [Hyphomicrobiales bacterium]
MTNRSLAIRLAVVDGGKVKAELRDVGDTGQRALSRIEDASRPASKALQALDGVTGEVRAGLEGMASRLGPVGSGLSRIGPAGLAAAAAIAGVGAALKIGFQEAAEADRSYRRLEAVLKATGFASGLTAQQIASFAEGVERSTLATAEAVQDAASVLATFRSVAGDTFTRALSLAQDLSAVFGQDLSSTATQLGKALEDPIQGISALRRVGVSFSESQRELIRTLVETGETADAQRVILDALEQQVGGAGAAEAGGLTGATNRLGDAWGNLLETLGRTPAVTGIARGALDVLSGGLERLASVLEEDSIAERIAATEARLADARSRLDSSRSGLARTVQQQRIADLEQELATLTSIGAAEADAAKEEQARAEAGRQAAEAERLAEVLAGQRRELDKAYAQLISEPAERIAKVNRELEETRQRLDALRSADGSNTADLDAAIGLAEEIARRKITAIEKPLADAAARARESVARQAATEQAAAERVYRANVKVIDDLSRQITTFGDERRQFVDQALSRLSDTATDTQRTQVQHLANALFDEKQARDELVEAMRAEGRLRQEGARLIEASRSPAEQLAATLAHLDELMRIGAIDAVTHGRAVADAFAEMEAAADQALRASRDWRDGIERALRDYASEATNAAQIAERVTTDAFHGMEDALVRFVETGKLDFRGLIDSMIADITRLTVRAAITGPLAGALASAFGSLGTAGAGTTTGGSGLTGNAVAGVTAHTGGIIGHDPLPRRSLPAALFAEAPRFHGGLAPGEFPAILKHGEGVFTPGQMAALGRVNVTVVNNTDAQVDVTERQGRDGVDIGIEINRAVGRAIRTRGSEAHHAVLDVAGQGPAMRQR